MTDEQFLIVYFSVTFDYQKIIYILYHTATQYDILSAEFLIFILLLFWS